eukprot:11916991-Alexandrium_andersonii.AAC.1
MQGLLDAPLEPWHISSLQAMLMEELAQVLNDPAGALAAQVQAIQHPLAAGRLMRANAVRHVLSSAQDHFDAVL